MNSIVIIEDHPLVRKGLASYFEQTGRWKVLGTASSLAEAKKLLANISADVLLLDIQLEDGWGLDIIPWISRNTQTLPLPAVYSTFDDYAHVSAALRMGVRAYITKRRNEKELEDAILEAHSGNIYIDEAARIKYQNVENLICLLTKRETEILCLVKSGLSNKQIAEQLGISPRTVENILSCVYDKTGIHSRLELERL